MIETLVYQLADIISGAAILYLVSLGLLIIFGIMRVINLAHSAFLVVGAYTSLVVHDFELTPWLGLPAAFMAGAGLGAILEVTIVRRLYDRPLDTILATWGVGIVIIQLITLYFGRGSQFSDPPFYAPFEIEWFVYSGYQSFLVLLAIGMHMIFYLIMYFTTFGLMARSVIMNEPLARGLGINTTRIRTLTFSLGAGLATFSGAAIAPMVSINPNLGNTYLIPAFMAVFISGPSLLGLVISVSILGALQAVLGYWISPILGSVAIVAIAMIIVRYFPDGLLSTGR